MKRDLSTLSARPFDVLVVGGGVYGACAAWDAALRGLSVAFIEKRDFGHATSANSLKILHGGLRYLQSADLRRMRDSIRERRAWMKIAPHLVRPQLFLMPTFGHFLRGREALALALALTDLVGFDRNRFVDPARHFPRGRVVNREECLRLLPGYPHDGVTGGALWTDGLALNTERLVLSLVLSAERSGATAANYVEAERLFRSGRQVRGVAARDRLTGSSFEIRARTIVNAVGPWADGWLRPAGAPSHGRTLFVKAMNLVTRPLPPSLAFGVPERGDRGRLGGRVFFFVPWQNRTLIGTAYFPYGGSPDELTATEEEVDQFCEDVGRAFPPAALERDDIHFVHAGLVPVSEELAPGGRPRLAPHPILVDHSREDALDGVFSVTGGKFTTARGVAEKVIDRICERLGKRRDCATSVTPLVGGDIEEFQHFVARETACHASNLSPESVRRLVTQYGSGVREIARTIDENADWGKPIDESGPTLRAEIFRALREEVAETLEDVVFRRTEIASAGHPGEPVLRATAAIIAAERGWTPARTEAEIAAVRRRFPRLRQPVQTAAAGAPR